MSPGEKAVNVEVSEDELKVELLDGRTITVPLAWYPRLLHATPTQRANWRIAGAGFGIHWPDIDEDLSVEGLLRGARRLGRSLRLSVAHFQLPVAFPMRRRSAQARAKPLRDKASP